MPVRDTLSKLAYNLPNELTHIGISLVEAAGTYVAGPIDDLHDFLPTIVKENVGMRATRQTPPASAANADKQVPATTFKNSLRAWQATWKAQRAGQSSPTAKKNNQIGC